MNWKNKKVLITGAGGFIGSHLTERLVKLGANVRAFVHYNALGTWGWLDQSPVKSEAPRGKPRGIFAEPCEAKNAIHPCGKPQGILAKKGKIEVVAGDICDRDSIRRAVEGREIVFHLAALITIPYSYHAPTSYIRTNIEGTLNVLQAAREAKVKRVIHTSTSEVYGTAQYVPIDEKHPLQGQSPYSASKIGADKIAEAFNLSFGLPVVTVRPFNTFGPRQSARAIIPTIITQLLDGKKIKLGNVTPTRDLNYVADTVEGFVLAASAPAAVGRAINLGSGREISISDLAQMVAHLMNKPLKIEEETQRLRPKNSEVERLLADNRLARKLLGWKPSISLENGLSRTIEWLLRHRDRYHASNYIL